MDGMWDCDWCGYIASPVETGINDINKAVSTAITETKKTVLHAAKQTELAIVNNKEILLKASKYIQDAGEITVKVGMSGAVITAGLAASGVGAVAPASGLVVAGIGGIISTVGVGLEVLTKAVTGDYEEAGESAVVEGSTILISKSIDVVIPGPNPSVTPLVKELIKTIVGDQHKKDVKNVYEKVIEN